MTIKRLALLVLFTAVSLSGARAVETLKASSRAPTLIILPALPRVLQIAFDVAQLRNVTLVTYQTRAGKATLLHMWNGTEWVSIAEDEIRAGAIGKVSPRNAILVGDDKRLPASLAQAVPWCSAPVRIDSIAVAELANGFDKVLKFKEKEWKWLAGRHELDLTDVNEAKREYNPYNTPRSKQPFKIREFKQKGKDDIPPATIVTDPPSTDEDQPEKANVTPSADSPEN